MRYHFLRFPGGKAKAITISYDDGSKNDIKLIDIADKYGLKVTLNINGFEDGIKNDGWRLSADELNELVKKGGHELAIHGADHLACGMVTTAEGIKDVLSCRIGLERVTGKIIRGMAYADSSIINLTAGVTKDEIKAYLKALGVAYARSHSGDNNRFQMPVDFYEWIPTTHHNNPNLMNWLDSFLNTPLKKGPSRRAPWLFYLWGHSYEFEDNNTWDIFEDFCKTAAGSDDVWFATNIEICDYTRDYYRLEFNVDKNIVHNPTARTIWFEANDKIYDIKAGETLYL